MQTKIYCMVFLKKFFLSMFLFLSLVSFGQQADFIWGPEKPLPDSYFGAVGRTKQYIYTFYYEKKNYYLNKIDPTQLNTISSTPIHGKLVDVAEEKNSTVEQLIFVNDHFLLFTIQKNKENKTNELYVRKISLDGKRDSDNKKVFSVIAKSEGLFGGGFMSSGSFDVILSRDSSKILIMAHPKYERKANEKVNLAVCDKNGSILNKVSVEIPVKDSDFSIEDFEFTNTMEVYILAKIYLTKAERKEKKKEGDDNIQKYYYKIISVDPKTQATSEFNLNLPDKYIDDAGLFIYKDGSLKCFGFYSNSKNSNKSYELNGMFYFSINTSEKSIENSNFKEFSKDMVTELESKRKANKGKGISDKFEIKSFIQKEDGGMLVLCEKAYVVVSTYTSSGANGSMQTRTTYNYYNEDILAINITPSGSISWYLDLPKYQHTVNDYAIFNSFFSKVVGDEVYLLLNDSPENAFTQGFDYKKAASVSKYVPVLIAIHEDGSYSKSPLRAQGQKDKFVLKPSLATDIKDKEILVASTKLNKACCMQFGSTKYYKEAILRFK